MSKIKAGLAAVWAFLTAKAWTATIAAEAEFESVEQFVKGMVKDAENKTHTVFIALPSTISAELHAQVSPLVAKLFETMKADGAALGRIIVLAPGADIAAMQKKLNAVEGAIVSVLDDVQIILASETTPDIVTPAATPVAIDPPILFDEPLPDQSSIQAPLNLPAVPITGGPPPAADPAADAAFALRMSLSSNDLAPSAAPSQGPHLIVDAPLVVVTGIVNAQTVSDPVDPTSYVASVNTPGATA